MKKGILSILILISGLLNAQINLTSGLTGYFPLDGNANDMSITAINGTNNGATSTTGFEGIPNTALDFVAAQSDYIDAGNNNRGITNQMSVSFWFKTTGSGTYHLVEKYNWTMDAGFYIFIQNGNMAMHGRDGSGVGVAPPVTSTTYNDGQWHHVVGIVDDTEWILNVDCQEIQHITTVTASPDISVNWPLTFGRYALDNNAYFDGQLDEIRIYNRILTTDEICYLCGSSANFTNQLTGYFKLDGNAYDASSTAINGTNNGAALTTGFDGTPNSALDFVAAQSDYIDAGNNNRGITNQMTASFWFKTTGTGTYHLLEKYNWTLDAGFYIPLINGAIALHGRDGSGSGVAPGLTGSYNDGQWHQVIAIVNQTEWLLYVDCELIQSVATFTGSPDISVNWPLTFGRYALDNNYYFDGQLDEIRIYNRLLSATEICHLCNNTVLMDIEEPEEADLNQAALVFTIFPNPANGNIQIDGTDKLHGEFTIAISDILGQRIASYKNQSWVDISPLSTGIYIIEIFDSNNRKVFSEKLIKQ